MTDALPLSDELLSLMRASAQKALDLHEGFITPRALLLTMVDDPYLGPRIAGVVNREKVLSAETSSTHAVRLPDDTFEAGDPAAIARYDTISFKTPDGRSSVWLTREAYDIFVEGAQRAGERYMPKHLALGFAAEAMHAPAVLAAIKVEPGALSEAIYRL
ncbi:MAG TPA: hypothetical protein VGZ02_02970 [Candidatus Baltobacteraceae bacterium]|jgi:hypothetical protein|nr:hypothetical protein [Candidatus Baltobacteraceae bacterium]